MEIQTETKKNYKAWALSIGVINILTGKTMYDWSIYENGGGFVTLMTGGHLLYDATNVFKPGDNVVLIGNDSQRKLKEFTVVDSAPVDKESVLAMLKKNGYDYYPIKAFRARAAGNRKLGVSYSIKGISNA